jgi:hypothetical protein
MAGGELAEVARQTLCELVAAHGNGLSSDARRCEGLLRDFCGQHRREIFVLVSALRDGVPADLLAHTGAVPAEAHHAQLARRLEEHLAVTSDAAWWAVESWASALGVPTVEPTITAFADVADDQESEVASATSAIGVLTWMMGVALLWAAVGGSAAAMVAAVAGSALPPDQHAHWIATGALAGGLLGALAGALMRAVGGAAGELVGWAVSGTVGGAALGAVGAGAIGALAGFALDGAATATARGLQWAGTGATAGALLTTLLGAAAWRPAPAQPEGER